MALLAPMRWQRQRDREEPPAAWLLKGPQDLDSVPAGRHAAKSGLLLPPLPPPLRLLLCFWPALTLGIAACCPSVAASVQLRRPAQTPDALVCPRLKTADSTDGAAVTS